MDVTRGLSYSIIAHRSNLIALHSSLKLIIAHCSNIVGHCWLILWHIMTYRRHSVGTAGYIVQHLCTAYILTIIVTPPKMIVAHRRYSVATALHIGNIVDVSNVPGWATFSLRWVLISCAALAMSTKTMNSVASFEHAQNFCAHHGSATLILWYQRCLPITIEMCYDAHIGRH